MDTRGDLELNKDSLLERWIQAVAVLRDTKETSNGSVLLLRKNDRRNLMRRFASETLIALKSMVRIGVVEVVIELTKETHCNLYEWWAKGS